MSIASDFLDRMSGLDVSNDNKSNGKEKDLNEDIADPFDLNDIYYYKGSTIRITAINANTVTIAKCDYNGIIDSNTSALVIPRMNFVKQLDWDSGKNILRNYKWSNSNNEDVLVASFNPVKVVLVKLDRNGNPLNGPANTLELSTQDFYDDLV